jgi:hypothetical protein
MPDRPATLICHRCGAALRPGRGDLYVVRIEAVSDPFPPDLTDLDLESTDLRAEIERAIEAMEGMSEQEMMDQVYRRLTMHLCGACYRQWIERPAG